MPSHIFKQWMRGEPLGIKRPEPLIDPNDESGLDPSRVHIECRHDYQVQTAKVNGHFELQQSIHSCGETDFRRLQCVYCQDVKTDNGHCKCF